MIPGFVHRQYSWTRTRLFTRYMLTNDSLVVGALLVSGGLDIFFTYSATSNSISDSEREEASFAASNIDAFIGDVQRNLNRAIQVESEDSESGIATRESGYLELSAGVAHDLRNPLGAIQNAIFYLKGKLLNGESANENPRIPEFLKIIEDEVGHSDGIITDLLDFTRIPTPTFSRPI